MAAWSANPAALLATQDPAFYNNTIRNLATPWTNRDQTVFVPLNDYTATVIGMVRDDVPFNTLLTADLIYIADRRRARPGLLAGEQRSCIRSWTPTASTCQVAPGASTQSALTGIPAAATAGVLTTRAAATPSSSTAPTARCSASP